MPKACGLVIVGLLLAGGTGTLRADQYHGLNAGAPIWNGAIRLTQDKAAAFAATGCRAVRLNFRLDGHSSWDPTLLAQYDTIVQNATSNHLVVLGLLCNECVPQWQALWNDDPDGDGMNDFVTQYAQSALLLVDRYKDRIKRWEIWNEPNAWTNPGWTDPKYAGGTYILPRVYANAFAESFKQLNYYNGRTILATNGITLVSGGLFAHDQSNSFSTAMDYMLQVYDVTAVWDALQAATGRRYPWSYFGYHFYLNIAQTVSTTEIGNYFNDVRTKQASRQDTTPLLITEFGWNTYYVNETTQKNNMRDTYNFMEGKSYVAGTYWYQWEDESDTDKWGIVRADATHKPSYDEFTTQNATPPPVASFTAAPLIGDTPLAVQFTSSSTGSIDAYAWTFGDGATSSETNPLHTYTTGGAFTVALTVTGFGGSNTLTRTNYIQVKVYARCDVDHDSDVDMDDFGRFQACFSGYGIEQIDPACQWAKLDADTDVDRDDLLIFQSCMGGAGVPADVNCGK